MDGFDDLLSNSRRVLEENPFDDPFAKRSNSPDPWASFGQTSQHDQHDDVFASHHDAFADSSGGYADNVYGTRESLERSDSNASSALDEVQTPSNFPQSPGFRESTSVEEGEHAQASSSPETVDGDADASSRGVRARSPSSVRARSRTPDSPKTPTVPTAPATPSTNTPAPRYPAPASPPSTSRNDSSKVLSPLEKSPGTGSLERPFASLALGGEFVGGWQEQTQPAFAPSHDSRESIASDTTPDKSLEPMPPSVPESKVRRSVLSLVISAQRSRASQSTTSRPAHPLPHPVVVAVDDPQKVGDPIRPYILYTVHTEVRLSNLTDLFYSQPTLHI